MDLPPLDFLNNRWVCAGVFVSTLTAIVLNRTSRFLEISKKTLPPSTDNDAYLAWKWRNFLISFVHAVISGTGTIICVLRKPILLTDMIGGYSREAYLLTSFSHGYFIYDLMEMLFNLKYKGTTELVCHHLFVISCMSISLLQERYLGYAALALVVELNNIFLHLRQLLNIAGVSKKSCLYRINCWVNLVTFIPFRVFVLIFLTMNMLEHKASVPDWIFWLGTVAVSAISVMTSVLFYRLVQSDFGSSSFDASLDSQKSHVILNGSSHNFKNKTN